jgi:threonyl-tRNA synthetase
MAHDITSYDEKILETYGMTPAELAEYHEDMRQIAREEYEAQERERIWEERQEQFASRFPDPDEQDFDVDDF